MKSLYLLRWEEGQGIRETTLYSSESLYELLDELAKVSFRIYAVGEGLDIEAAARRE